MITPIRGRKLKFKPYIEASGNDMLKDDNPDKGTETEIRIYDKILDLVER